MEMKTMKLHTCANCKGHRFYIVMLETRIAEFREKNDRPDIETNKQFRSIHCTNCGESVMGRHLRIMMEELKIK